MADDNTSTAGDSQTTSGGDGKNTQDLQTGADTQAATTSTEGKQQQIDITQSPEFKAAVTDAIKAKLPQLQRQARAAVAKELNGDKSSGEPPTLEAVTKERDDASKRADDALARLRIFEAAEQVEEFITDKRNNTHVRNIRGLLKMIRSDYEFDDEGKVTNLKDLLASAKRDAPELFGVNAGSADGGRGNGQVATMDMNTLIRGR